MLFTDQTGREVKMGKSPTRIISTVPSQTELLYDLGLEDRVVGTTAYCVHPAHWLQEKTVIGGTKNLQVEKIKSLRPHLIIGNKEENEREQIEELESICPVWLSDVKTVEDALEMIAELGKITDTAAKADQLCSEIEEEYVHVKGQRLSARAAYFIWKDPYMLASQDTFINSMMDACGLANIVETTVTGRYPAFDLKEISKKQPHVVLLSSEPYAFKVADMHAMESYFPRSLLKIVDGEMFSWYGSRMLRSFHYMKGLQEELKLLNFS